MKQQGRSETSAGQTAEEEPYADESGIATARDGKRSQVELVTIEEPIPDTPEQQQARDRSSRRINDGECVRLVIEVVLRRIGSDDNCLLGEQPPGPPGTLTHGVSANPNIFVTVSPVSADSVEAIHTRRSDVARSPITLWRVPSGLLRAQRGKD